MSAIIPRWEWRTFGTRFGVAEERFAALESTGVQESDETYLLGGATGNAKIRDGLMDIKLLRETQSDLERWEPVMKTAFPIGADDARAVFTTLEMPAPSLDRDRYTTEQFLDDVTGRDGPLGGSTSTSGACATPSTVAPPRLPISWRMGRRSGPSPSNRRTKGRCSRPSARWVWPGT